MSTAKNIYPSAPLLEQEGLAMANAPPSYEEAVGSARGYLPVHVPSPVPPAGPPLQPHAYIAPGPPPMMPATPQMQNMPQVPHTTTTGKLCFACVRAFRTVWTRVKRFATCALTVRATWVPTPAKMQRTFVCLLTEILLS
uniref:LITAF domain-containing protein n=1 Tax=Timema tahoe TaxID=61484 RepID=A0A7R9IB01_9NEOP|nr:unnamed protein product [Timema tahoe]